MSSPVPVTHSIDADLVGWITFAAHAGLAQGFSPATQAAFAAAMTALSAQPVRAIVVQSASERIFVTGTEFKPLQSLEDPASAAQFSRAGQALFARVAQLPVPVVGAIHGVCAGAGCELALACHWRIASDARQTVMGLTEVALGLIPAWGGIVRLTRLVGAEAAVQHLLKAALLPAAAALVVGFVDEVVPMETLKARAKARALDLAAKGLPVRGVPPLPSPDFFAMQRRAAEVRLRGQPAPLAVLTVVEQGAGLALAAALELEATQFGALATGAVAKNFQYGLALKERGQKMTLDAWFPADAGTGVAQACNTVGVIGAGVMGSGIAHWCATRGRRVILCDHAPEAVARGLAVIGDLFKQAEQRGKVPPAETAQALARIGTATRLEDLSGCDLVIEAIAENKPAKQKLFAALSAIVRPDCVLASNTSALPIEDVAGQSTNPGRMVGLHFFNPVSRMPLVELVLSRQTTRATADRALTFVQGLGKTPVVCRSAPGFLVTRVLFFYLNEACRLWELGVPGEKIDRAMRDWGWPMGPLRLIDEVGVDVTDFIFGEMQHYYPDRFTPTTICARMLAAGLKGRKNGASSGFYVYTHDGEVRNMALAAMGAATAVAREPAAIADQLNGVLMAETKQALVEGVIKSPEEADLALLLGAGFPAFRGGLMRYAKSVGLFSD